MILAKMQDNLPVVYLVSQGVDIDEPVGPRLTALMIASHQCHLHVI
mgnify:CR=1 FL=1